ncbi:MAG: hypothetical protein JNL88_05140 [Bacteroidia bacterium]|nr:hypothetical protein [Bacteroidia bacterium]
MFSLFVQIRGAKVGKRHRASLKVTNSGPGNRPAALALSTSISEKNLTNKYMPLYYRSLTQKLTRPESTWPLKKQTLWQATAISKTWFLPGGPVRSNSKQKQGLFFAEH